MLPVLSAFERAAAALAKPARPLSAMEDRQLKEAEKGIATLKASLCAGCVGDHVQLKLAEMAAAFDAHVLLEAQRVQVGLTSTDWADCKEWLKGLRHLITLAARDDAPPQQHQQQQQPSGPPSYAPPPPQGQYQPPQSQYPYGQPPGHLPPPNMYR
jgi:hypothetical protein